MADYWSFHTDEEFKGKTKHELQLYALVVMAELGSVVGHALRVTYAQKVLSGEANIEEVCIAAITNAAIKTHVTDGTDYTNNPTTGDNDLEYVVQTNFNAFAGVYNAAA